MGPKKPINVPNECQKEINVGDWEDVKDRRGVTITSKMIDKVRLVLGEKIRIVKRSPTDKRSISFCRLCFQPNKPMREQAYAKKEYKWEALARHLIDGCEKFANCEYISEGDIRQALKDLKAPRTESSNFLNMQKKYQPTSSINAQGIPILKAPVSQSPAGRPLYSASDIINSKATTLYSTGKLSRDVFDTIELEEYAVAFKHLAPGEKLVHSSYTVGQDLEKEVQAIDHLQSSFARKVGCFSMTCDGWKFTDKEKILGFSFTREGLKTNKCKLIASESGLETAKEIERAMLDMNAKQQLQNKRCRVNCLVTDDAGNNRWARSALSFRYPNLFIFRCFAHQMNLISKDVCKSFDADFHQKVRAFLSIMEKPELNERLQTCLKSLYPNAIKNKKHGEYKFSQFYDIRWNSMYETLSSINQISEALRTLLRPENNDDEAPIKVFRKLCQKSSTAKKYFHGRTYVEIYKKVKNFLSKCKRLCKTLEPVALGNLWLQAEGRTLSDVVYCFLIIYNGFEKTRDDTKREDMLSILEKRWESIEQPLFLLSFSLDPRFYQVFYFMTTCFFNDTSKEQTCFTYLKANFKENCVIGKETVQALELLKWAVYFYRSKFLSEELSLAAQLNLKLKFVDHFDGSYEVSMNKLCREIKVNDHANGPALVWKSKTGNYFLPIPLQANKNNEAAVHERFKLPNVAYDLLSMRIHSCDTELLFKGYKNLKKSANHSMKNIELLHKNRTFLAQERKIAKSNKPLRILSRKPHRNPEASMSDFTSSVGTSVEAQAGLPFGIERGSSIDKSKKGSPLPKEGNRASGIEIDIEDSAFAISLQDIASSDDISLEEESISSSYQSDVDSEIEEEQPGSFCGPGEDTGDQLPNKLFDEHGKRLSKTREENIRKVWKILSERDITDDWRAENPLVKDSPRLYPKDYMYFEDFAKRGAKVKLRHLFFAWTEVLTNCHEKIERETHLPKHALWPKPFVKYTKKDQELIYEETTSKPQRISKHTETYFESFTEEDLPTTPTHAPTTIHQASTTTTKQIITTPTHHAPTTVHQASTTTTKQVITTTTHQVSTTPEKVLNRKIQELLNSSNRFTKGLEAKRKRKKTTRS